MYIPATANQNTVLSLLLEDGDSDKHPKAKVYDASGTLVASYDMAHQALGRYAAVHLFEQPGDFFVVYVVYDDATQTAESEGYYRTDERFIVSVGAQPYGVRQAWTRNSPNMVGTVWLEQGSQRVSMVPGDRLTVTAKIGSALVFSHTSMEPNPDGRFNVSVLYRPSPGTLIDIDAQVITARGSFKSQTSLSIPKLSA